VTVAALARPEIYALRAYQAPGSRGNAVRLNANEAPCDLASGLGDGINRYPVARATSLNETMAKLYGVPSDSVLATRGSSEGIDLLVRAFCAPGVDQVLTTPPAFEMYAVYATIQGLETLGVPLLAARDFAMDTDALLRACTRRTKLIFLCSPNNPAGTVIPRTEIERVLQERRGQSLVVVDEAYIEFSDGGSLAGLVGTYDNLVVLRTLSKAYALAGARCGAIIASPVVTELVARILPPYALSSLVIQCAETALSAPRLELARQAIARTVSERQRVGELLATSPAVQYIWPSQGNFLLIKVRDREGLIAALAAANIEVRSYPDSSILRDCIRITIGSADDNDRLLQAMC
jgi:histidinol-phosphate aminotransferase